MRTVDLRHEQAWRAQAALRRILNALAAIGASIEPAGDRLVLRAGNVPVPSDIVDRVRAVKTELLTLLAAPEPGFEQPCFARRGRIVLRPDVWVWFGDLPDATCEELKRRIDAGIANWLADDFRFSDDMED